MSDTKTQKTQVEANRAAPRIVFVQRTEGSGKLASTSFRPAGQPGSLTWTDHLEEAFSEWVKSQDPRPGDIFEIIEEED